MGAGVDVACPVKISKMDRLRYNLVAVRGGDGRPLDLF